jgi:hypothetical protein
VGAKSQDVPFLVDPTDDDAYNMTHLFFFLTTGGSSAATIA